MPIFIVNFKTILSYVTVFQCFITSFLYAYILGTFGKVRTTYLEFLIFIQMFKLKILSFLNF
jgi:hypothetical protein